MTIKQRKAIALLSGGLDSSLAIRAIQHQGIEVVGLHCVIPFLRHETETVCESSAQKIAEQLTCRLRVLDISEEFLSVLKDPSHGYGKNLNPCIDCKILMLKKAKQVMLEEGAQFVITGEVVNQRPMSQHLRSLQEIEKESGLTGLLVRPLSALVLPKTIPQEKGWLKEGYLFDISGRARSRQIELADQWGLKDYPWPGGGCRLTDTSFCHRISDLMAYDALSVENVKLAKRGRFFRINPRSFLIVGRDETENGMLGAQVMLNDTVFYPYVLSGPTAVGRGPMDEEEVITCSRIVARYTQRQEKIEIKVVQGGQEKVVSVEELSHEELKESLR